MTNKTTDIVGWASEPQGRGTIGLLWSCFATIFLCTWSAIHPNLPGLKDTKTRILWQRIQNVMLCLLVPEIYGLRALINLMDARYLRKKTPHWSLKRCFFLLMGGFSIEHESGGQRHRKRLKPADLIKLFEQQSLPWPEIDDAEIDDHSKADGLVKLLSLAQILWFVTQAIGRAAQGLAMTTLELFTLGIVLWAVIIYCVSWEKPFDVQRPIVIRVDGREAEEAVSSKSDCRENKFFPSTTHNGTETNFVWCLLISALVSLGFSALHVIAWKFYFSTSPELWLWRVSSVLCATSPLILALFMWLHESPGLQYLVPSETAMKILLCLLAGLYTLGRLYMFVEMFISLRAVPASVYQTPQWSQYFPSIG